MPARKWSLAKLYDQGRQPTCTDYRLKREHTWIEVENLVLYIKKEDEGVVVDIYPVGGEMRDPIASTFAFFDEGALEW
jgi:hypothetical protein